MKLTKDLKIFMKLQNLIMQLNNFEKNPNKEVATSIKNEMITFINENWAFDKIIEEVMNLELENKHLRELLHEKEIEVYNKEIKTEIEPIQLNS